MAVVARKSVSRKVPYAKLRERFYELVLPRDDEAERLVIGAVLLAPPEWAKKLSVRLHSGHFYDVAHGWIWEQLMISKGQPDLRKMQPAFKERFMWSMARDLRACVTGCFWWHGRYFIDRVIEAAKLRAAIIGGAEKLGIALDKADAWRAKLK